MNSSANQLPVDEQPITTRDHGQRRVGASPDSRFVESSGRYGGGSEAGGADDSQGSPPKSKPRILHSAEGLRPYPSREDRSALTRFLVGIGLVPRQATPSVQKKHCCCILGACSLVSSRATDGLHRGVLCDYRFRSHLESGGIEENTNPKYFILDVLILSLFVLQELPPTLDMTA